MMIVRPMIVWLMMIVRLSGHPLIQDSLSGPGPGRCSRILNTFNKILVFDLSLATGLYALTIYAGTVMGTRHRGNSRSSS